MDQIEEVMMFKRFWAMWSGNAQVIHDINCGADPADYQVPKPAIPAVMYCKHCGCEVAPDEDTHVCTSMEVPK